MLNPTRPRNIIIVVQDDYIRHIIRALFSKYSNIQVFTSNNGVEGVGYAVITNPDLIILDSNLPKYSGVELINFLKNKEKYNQKRASVIVIHENNDTLKVPEHYITLNREDDDFLDKLILQIRDDLKIVETKDKKLLDQLRLKLSRKLVHSSNRVDRLIKKTENHTYLEEWISNIGILVLKLRETINFSLFFLLSGRGKEENIDQDKEDSLVYRVRVYPTLTIFFASILMIVSQILLLAVGGIVIFNTHIVSVFASTSPERTYILDLSQSVYLSDEIAYSNQSLELKELNKEIIEPATSTDESSDINNNSIKRMLYSDSSPVVHFNQKLTCANPVLISELATKSDGLESQITYQLSPNFREWYFFNFAKNNWEIVNEESFDSNAVNELNQSLEKYQNSRETKSLYIRSFFHSDGRSNISLHELKVTCK